MCWAVPANHWVTDLFGRHANSTSRHKCELTKWIYGVSSELNGFATFATWMFFCTHGHLWRFIVMLGVPFIRFYIHEHDVGNIRVQCLGQTTKCATVFLRIILLYTLAEMNSRCVYHLHFPTFCVCFFVVKIIIRETRKVQSLRSHYMIAWTASASSDNTTQCVINCPPNPLRLLNRLSSMFRSHNYSSFRSPVRTLVHSTFFPNVCTTHATAIILFGPFCENDVH